MKNTIKWQTIHTAKIQTMAELFKAIGQYLRMAEQLNVQQENLIYQKLEEREAVGDLYVLPNVVLPHIMVESGNNSHILLHRFDSPIQYQGGRVQLSLTLVLKEELNQEEQKFIRKIMHVIAQSPIETIETPNGIQTFYQQLAQLEAQIGN